MTVPTSLLAYQDCLEVMEQALADPLGARMHFPTESAAWHFRSRCHYGRKLHRERNTEIYPEPDHPMHGRSAYDALTLKIKPDGDGAYVYLERTDIVRGKIEPLSQAPEEPETKPEPRPTALEVIRRRL